MMQSADAEGIVCSVPSSRSGRQGSSQARVLVAYQRLLFVQKRCFSHHSYPDGGDKRLCLNMKAETDHNFALSGLLLNNAEQLGRSAPCSSPRIWYLVHQDYRSAAKVAAVRVSCGLQQAYRGRYHIETPSASLIADSWLECDPLLSIGTNDLKLGYTIKPFTTVLPYEASQPSVLRSRSSQREQGEDVVRCSCRSTVKSFFLARRCFGTCPAYPQDHCCLDKG